MSEDWILDDFSMYFTVLCCYSNSNSLFLNLRCKCDEFYSKTRILVKNEK